MTKAKQWILRASLVLALAAPLAACNTVEGIGEDTQAAGRGLEKAADGNKTY